jgi:hypothetical protein
MQTLRSASKYANLARSRDKFVNTGCRWFRSAPVRDADTVCKNLPPAAFCRTNPAGGAIFGGQFDNSSRKSLFYKDFFGFLGEILRKYFVTTPCEPSGLEPSTIF